MSSILKALRKLEEERASRREGGLDIARDILRRPVSSRRRPSLWRKPVAVSLAILLLGAGVWGVMQRLAPLPLPFENAGKESGSPPPPAPVASQSATETPVAPPVSRFSFIKAEPEILEETIDDPPAARVGEKSVRPPAPSRRQTPALSAEASAKRSAVVAETSPPAPAAVPPARQPEPTSAGVAKEATIEAPAVAPPLPRSSDQNPVQVRPSLVVSGIAFHDDPEARLAVVNDLPVMRGTSVEGAMVEEILSDRVRFSRDGKSFEVRMGD